MACKLFLNMSHAEAVGVGTWHHAQQSRYKAYRNAFFLVLPVVNELRWVGGAPDRCGGILLLLCVWSKYSASVQPHQPQSSLFRFCLQIFGQLGPPQWVDCSARWEIKVKYVFQGQNDAVASSGIEPVTFPSPDTNETIAVTFVLTFPRNLSRKVYVE